MRTRIISRSDECSLRSRLVSELVKGKTSINTEGGRSYRTVMETVIISCVFVTVNKSGPSVK